MYLFACAWMTNHAIYHGNMSWHWSISMPYFITVIILPYDKAAMLLEVFYNLKLVRKRCLISLQINFEWQIYHCLSLYHRVKNVSAAVNNVENLFGLLVCHCSYSELFPPVDFIQTVVWLDRVLTICLFFLLSKQDPRVHLQVLPGRACQLAFPKLLA